MIQFVTAPPCGNCLSILVQPPLKTQQWRLLRRLDGGFTGYDDPDAETIYTGVDDQTRQIYDWESPVLENGVEAFYALYIHDVSSEPNQWRQSGDTKSQIPAYQSHVALLDVREPTEVVRSRLELGLNGEMAAGNIRHPNNVISVLRSPPLVDATVFPSVTALLEMRRNYVMGIGENVLPDAVVDGEILESEGRLDRSEITIGVWALNAHQRAQYRDAIKRVLMLNFTIFESSGMSQPEIEETELFDQDTYSAPTFISKISLTVTHPSLVSWLWQTIKITEVEPTAIPGRFSLP